MRYIPKPSNSEARLLLDKARMEMRTIGISEIYDHFNEKKQLNDILRKEQKMICCYCQRRIDHFQGGNEAGSHNEHFMPERGSYARVDLQLDYENLFACCNISKGFEKRLQHCGEHKGQDMVRRNFLRMRNCSDYFKYNTNGEILPQCHWNSFQEILEHKNELTYIQKDALQMIEVLNLNVESLMTFRRNVLNDILSYAHGKSRQQLERKVQILNTKQDEYIQLLDMVLFFLKKFAQKAKVIPLQRSHI